MPQQYTITLRDMVGHVRAQKPNADPNLIRDYINQAIRHTLDLKVCWAGTLRQGFIQVPAAYTTGTLALTAGSATATGTNTAWPVNDKVGTTVTAAVSETGLQWVTPGSMTGIDVDTMLYVDAAGNAEILPVLEVGTSKIRMDFKKTHSGSFTLTASSLAGRQIRLGMNHPTYSIRAVASATSLILEQEWAGVNYSSGPYSIVKMYYTLTPEMKALLFVVDPVQPMMLRSHYHPQAMSYQDPQRSQSGPPMFFVDYVPNEAGNMQYELYPPQTAARHLVYWYGKQWPDLRADGDRPPWFINPNVFLWYALAQVFLDKREAKDPFYDPTKAQYYRNMADLELITAMNADESKVQNQLTQELSRLGVGFGGPWAVQHGVTVAEMNSGGRWW